MFLKSLTLKGFKSFADTTTLDFEPGVTVVVGPNGSGKSNIVDAVAWVLGAQGPRTVRSSKMEDVIFAGTPKRPALGRAEVSLTIDNQAGLLPIEFTEVTVTRTLFRSGDSEYAINGVPCRLLDIQEILSDTGVGRQQHVIVSQGQLDAVLNARPEDRRLIIEEAAGILKYRRRKEKAERRLESTEGSLLRLQDLLREVRRQLRPLERQADAARRHGDLEVELRAVRRYLAGRELAGVEARLGAGARARVDLVRAEEEQRVSLGELDRRVAAAEAELSTVHGGAELADLADAWSRAERLRATANGLVALIGERRRSAERDRLASVDQDVVATLEAESVRVARSLAETDASADALIPMVEELTAAEAALEAETRVIEGRAGEHPESRGGDRPGAGGGEALADVRAEAGALRAAVETGDAELGRLDSRLGALEARAARLDEEVVRLHAAAHDAAESRRGADPEEAGRRRQAAAAALQDAEAVQTERDAEHHRWSARAEALALALDEARARAGAERLAGVEGVVGTLLDLVEVEEGWGAAFEAAAGEAVAAIVVDDADTARRSLDRLRSQDTSGAVVPIALPGREFDGGGSNAHQAARRLGVTPMRSLVRARARPAVEQLLDRLLTDAVVVQGDWTEALDIAIQEPGLVVVTRAGDRFAATGWRTGAAGSGATGAALDDALARAGAAAEAAVRQAGEVVTRRAALEHSRREEAELTRLRDAGAVRWQAVQDALARAGVERRDLVDEQHSLLAVRAALTSRLAEQAGRLAELKDRLPALEVVASEQAQRATDERARRARLAERAGAVAALRRDVEVRAASLEQRRAMLTARLEELESWLRRHATQREQLEARREHLERVAVATDRLLALVASRLDHLDQLAAGLREARSRQAEAARAVSALLDGLRGERVAAERRLGELRERLSRIQLEEAEARVRLETLADTVRRDLDCEPEALRDEECPPLPAGTSPTTRVRELERELRLMGPINPLAVEEHTALQERHAFLEGQLGDVRSARRELGKVIRAVDAEIVEVFRAAYADVADNFEQLFTTLFPGGQGRLRLTDPDHLLDTGIDVEARPSGKNVRRLSLLSGGERSLVALAFLFAVFRSRPSPFYLMDEVEAALDDVNLHRFLDLLREFRQEAQLLVVSHQKRTMEAADWLYGVTMQPGGSSRVVSERIGAGA